MANIVFANYAAGTLVAALPAASTSMLAALVANGDPFPTVSSPKYYYLTIVDAASYMGGVAPPAQREIVKVTNYAGSGVMTVTRGLDGTTAQNWAAGDRVELRVTAAVFDDSILASLLSNSYNTTTSAFRITYEPNQTYDLTAIATPNDLAVTEYYKPASTITVPPSKYVDLMRLDATVATGANSAFTWMRSNIIDNTASAQGESNAFVGAISSGGKGAIKSLYGRATGTTGFTGVAVGVVAAVDSVATANTTWAMQLGYGGVSGTQSAFIFCGGDSTNSILNGIVVSLTKVDASVLQWNQLAGQSAGATFLQVYNSSSADIFHVDALGTLSAQGVKIKTATNGRIGSAVLAGGTNTVTNTSVTANTKIFMTRSTTGGTAGHLSYTVSANTSFTINSSSGTDTSTINWLLVETW